MFSVYMLRGPKNHLYVGCTGCGVEVRRDHHKAGFGAEFTKRNKAFEIVYEENFSTLLDARKREKQIKGWRREKKENLIKLGNLNGKFK